MALLYECPGVWYVDIYRQGHSEKIIKKNVDNVIGENLRRRIPRDIFDNEKNSLWFVHHNEKILYVRMMQTHCLR